MEEQPPVFAVCHVGVFVVADEGMSARQHVDPYLVRHPRVYSHRNQRVMLKRMKHDEVGVRFSARDAWFRCRNTSIHEANSGATNVFAIGVTVGLNVAVHKRDVHFEGRVNAYGLSNDGERWHIFCYDDDAARLVVETVAQSVTVAHRVHGRIQRNVKGYVSREKQFSTHTWG